jgi:hypothetical protein
MLTLAFPALLLLRSLLLPLLLELLPRRLNKVVFVIDNHQARGYIWI